MSQFRFRYFGSLAVSAAIACAATGCVIAPLVSDPGIYAGGTVGSSNDGPVIQALDATPKQVTSKDDVITFMVKTYSPSGAPLQYSWSATKGTLSTTTGQVVTWRPEMPDGKLVAGDAQITLLVTAGGQTATGTATIRIAPDGSASVQAAGPQPTSAPAATPTPAPSTSATAAPSAEPTKAPSAVPTAQATPSAAPSASSSASPSVAACTVGAVSPLEVAPDKEFVISGTGFEAPVAVQLGARDAEIVKVEATQITVRVPKDMPVGTEKLVVTVTACKQSQPAKGTITVVQGAAPSPQPTPSATPTSAP